MDYTELPPSPDTCQGFIYIVQQGDTLMRLSQVFGITIQQLLDANPQIVNLDWIFIGQEICIPVPLKKEVPEIVSIEFADETGRSLPVVRGFVKLEPVTVIKVTFSINITSVFFFMLPLGNDSFEPARLIGTVDVENKRAVKFPWKVPATSFDYIFVVGCNGDICKMSKKTGVFREEAALQD
jgi:hypothetical protein